MFLHYQTLKPLSTKSILIWTYIRTNGYFILEEFCSTHEANHLAQDIYAQNIRQMEYWNIDSSNSDAVIGVSPSHNKGFPSFKLFLLVV